MVENFVAETDQAIAELEGPEAEAPLTISPDEANNSTSSSAPAPPDSHTGPASPPAPSNPAAPAPSNSAVSNPVTASLFSWLKRLKLGKINPARLRTSLSNGFLIAEVLSRFFPAAISTHSFGTGVATATKRDNWNQLAKFFARQIPQGDPERSRPRPPVLKPSDVAVLMDASSGPAADEAAIHVLLDVYRFLFKSNLVPKLSAFMSTDQKDGAVKMLQQGAATSAQQKEEKKKKKEGAPRQKTKKEREEEERRNVMMGYRTVLHLISGIAEAIAKSPKHSNRGGGGMGSKLTINVNKIFNVFDLDMTKDIDLDEFEDIIRKELKISKKKQSSEDVKKVFELMDRDASGSITLSEFASYSREAQRELKKNPFDEEELERETKAREAKEKLEAEKNQQKVRHIQKPSTHYTLRPHPHQARGGEGEGGGGDEAKPGEAARHGAQVAPGVACGRQSFPVPREEGGPRPRPRPRCTIPASARRDRPSRAHRPEQARAADAAAAPHPAADDYDPEAVRRHERLVRKRKGAAAECRCRPAASRPMLRIVRKRRCC
jgi:hypothetical protein